MRAEKRKKDGIPCIHMIHAIVTKTPATSVKEDDKMQNGGSGSGGSQPQQTRKRQLVTQSARP